MAPSLRAFFLAAFFLCLTSAPSLAEGLESDISKEKTLKPIDWPSPHYPCKKLPTEETACLIDEMLRHIKADQAETLRGEKLFNRIVYSAARWGNTRQKEFLLNSLIDMPPRTIAKEPDDKALVQLTPVAAEETWQYPIMILLLSLGKIDEAVDFLKESAKTTIMPQPRPPYVVPPQIDGIDFLLQTQTVDTAYDFAQKTADIFYIIPEGTPKLNAPAYHPLRNLLSKQLHTHGFAARLKVTKLFQGDNVYNWLSPNFNIDEAIIPYAQKSKEPDAKAYYNKSCNDWGARAVLNLKETRQKDDHPSAAKVAEFSRINGNLYQWKCFTKHPEILLSFIDDTKEDIPVSEVEVPVPDAAQAEEPSKEWHGLASAPKLKKKTKGMPPHAVQYQNLLEKLQQQARVYKDIKDNYAKAASQPEKTPKDTLLRIYGQVEPVPQEMMHTSYFWAALQCPAKTQRRCIQKISEEYRAFYLDNIAKTSSRTRVMPKHAYNIEHIQDFISHFKSTLQLNDFIEPKALFADASASSLAHTSSALIKIKSRSPPEVAALYAAEAKAAEKKNPLINIFLTTHPNSIRTILGLRHEEISYFNYIATVLPALDAARFDTVKDAFWQTYIHQCLDPEAYISYIAPIPHRLEWAYARCIHIALNDIARVAEMKKQLPPQ